MNAAREEVEAADCTALSLHKHNREVGWRGAGPPNQPGKAPASQLAAAGP
jgi:hypothetical protein